MKDSDMKDSDIMESFDPNSEKFRSKNSELEQSGNIILGVSIERLVTTMYFLFS